MRQKTLGLVHTSPPLVPVFQELCETKLPDVGTFNIVDDSLIKEVIRKGGLTPSIARRAVHHIVSAEEAGADTILVTCSSIGRAVETATGMVEVPVLRVDQPMADRAVQTAGKIGVVATLPTTLEPTADLIYRRAKKAAREVELVTRLCPGAFQALMRGNAARHDAIVVEHLKKLASEVEIIVLAQASMARVVERLPEADRRIPILASPPLAIDYLATTL